MEYAHPQIRYSRPGTGDLSRDAVGLEMVLGRRQWHTDAVIDIFWRGARVVSGMSFRTFKVAKPRRAMS